MAAHRVLISSLTLLLAAALVAHAQASIEYARHQIERGAFKEAAQTLEDMDVRSPGRSDVYSLLVTAYLNLHKPVKAAAVCERAWRTVQPGKSALDSTCVAVLRRTLPPAEAQKKLIDALTSNPHSPVLQKAVARLMFEANPEDERAGALLASAARELPDDAEAHFFFGQWLCLNGREPACVQELKTAAEKTDESNNEALAQIWALMATARGNMGEWSDASALWEKAWKAIEQQKRPSPDLAVQYAAFLRKSAQRERAGDILRWTLHRYPEFGPAHFEAAQIAFGRHDIDAAVRESTAALQYPAFSDEERRTIHSFLATVYASEGRYADAERERASTARQ